MATSGKFGFDPYEGFLDDSVLPSTPNWQRTLEILDTRLPLLKYLNQIGGGCFGSGEYFRIPEYNPTFEPICGAIDALKGATGTLGVEFATVLRMMIPECRRNDDRFEVNCYDFPEDIFVHALVRDVSGNPVRSHLGHFVNACPYPAHSVLLQDDRYAILIEGGSTAYPSNKTIFHLYFHKLTQQPTP